VGEEQRWGSEERKDAWEAGYEPGQRRLPCGTARRGGSAAGWLPRARPNRPSDRTMWPDRARPGSQPGAQILQRAQTLLRYLGIRIVAYFFQRCQRILIAAPRHDPG